MPLDALGRTRVTLTETMSSSPRPEGSVSRNAKMIILRSFWSRQEGKFCTQQQKRMISKDL